ncbi:MAG: hypothetical protein VYD19_09390 [Myxococcota bacterium]|nr:hypothetical protein [Myxococcota bacterium]
MVGGIHNALQPVVLELAREKLRGFSISGLATWLELPELNLCFDMGECPVSAVSLDHVFLTHGHGDHSRCLMRHHALRKMFGIEKAASYYLPAQLLPAAKRWIRASAGFENPRLRHPTLPHLIPLTAGDPPLRLTHRSNLSVTAFPVEHGVPSLGYTISDARKKLRPEFHGLPGREIAALKREGVKVDAPVYLPRLTFIGDCTGRTLTREAHIWESPVLVIECTFIGAGEEQLAQERGHTHINDIARALIDGGDAIKSEAIVLKHFSMKISAEEAFAAVETSIPERFRERISLLLEPSIEAEAGHD